MSYVKLYFFNNCNPSLNFIFLDNYFSAYSCESNLLSSDYAKACLIPLKFLFFIICNNAFSISFPNLKSKWPIIPLGKLSLSKSDNLWKVLTSSIVSYPLSVFGSFQPHSI